MAMAKEAIHLSACLALWPQVSCSTSSTLGAYREQQLGRSLLARLLALSDADGFVPLCSRVFNCHGRRFRVVAWVVSP